MTIEPAAHNFLVKAVDPASPAARAGITAGDTLEAIDGKTLAGLGHRSVAHLLAPASGAEVSVRVRTASGQTRDLRLRSVAAAEPRN